MIQQKLIGVQQRPQDVANRLLTAVLLGGQVFEHLLFLGFFAEPCQRRQEELVDDFRVVLLFLQQALDPSILSVLSSARAACMACIAQAARNTSVTLSSMVVSFC